jgi:hypothetical protein
MSFCKAKTQSTKNGTVADFRRSRAGRTPAAIDPRVLRGKTQSTKNGMDADFRRGRAGRMLAAMDP